MSPDDALMDKLMFADWIFNFDAVGEGKRRFIYVLKKTVYVFQIYDENLKRWGPVTFCGCCVNNEQVANIVHLARLLRSQVRTCSGFSVQEKLIDIHPKLHRYLEDR